jgi:3-hydroxyacyl-CoA dehydrogenase
VRKNAGASLVDLGDGVLTVEFHSKMNAIGGDTIQMLQEGVREASKNFTALVVGNDAVHFSAGANLMLVLLEAQEENWDEIDSDGPCVSADDDGAALRGCSGHRRARGLAIGGGCEIVASRGPRAGSRGGVHRPR